MHAPESQSEQLLALSFWHIGPSGTVLQRPKVRIVANQTQQVRDWSRTTVLDA
jgi:hypothetical protein